MKFALRASEILLRSMKYAARMKCAAAHNASKDAWANFISHSAERNISCAEGVFHIAKRYFIRKGR